MGWKMREAVLHMIQFKIPFQKQDVIAMLDWSAYHSNTPAYIYFSGVPQITGVVSRYLEHHPMSDDLHASTERLVHSLEAASMSIEVRRWLLRLKELMGETQVSLPLVAGDAWADTALKEIYAMNTRTKTAWAELLRHCSQAAGPAPSRRWLVEADKYIDAIGDLYLFIKLSHWFPLVDQPQTPSANATILQGLVWLCSTSEDPDIAVVLAGLATSSFEANAVKLANACLWALANMPAREGIAQLHILRDRSSGNSAQRKISRALEAALRH
jgi:hypothetical protein